MASQEEGNSSQVGEDDSHILDCSQLHLNLLAMLALKSTFNEEITDCRMWTVRMDEIFKQSIDYVVFTCKRHGVGKDSQGWTCLVAPSQSQEVWSDGMSLITNQDHCHELVEHFKIYRRLMRDPDQVINLGNVEEVFIYTNNSGRINLPQDMIEESEEEDFIFGSKLLNLKNAIEGQKKLMNEVLGECYSKKEEHCHDLLMSDIRGFFQKVAFVTECPNWEVLKTSAKVVIQQHTDNADPDSVLERLMATIRGLWKNKEVQRFITCLEFKNLFEDVLIGRMEMVALRFNLSEPVSDFVGRESQLKEMIKVLEENSQPLKVGLHRKLVICGLGGMGKSELARQYCKRHFISLYDSVAWINAENDEVIGNCFRALAFDKLKIKNDTLSGKLKDNFTIIRETIDKLKSQRTLLIYDNAESLLKIKKYLPDDAIDGHIHIIITSRFQDWKNLPLILLDSFHPKEALAMVKRSLGRLPSWNKDDGQTLCKALDYYPLALKQAVSYIHEQSLQKGDMAVESLHIPEYLHLLQDRTEFVLDHSLSHDYEGYCTKTTFKVLMNTIDHLKKSLPGQIAITFLNIITYLSPDCIDIASMSVADTKYSRDVVSSSFTLLSKLSLVSTDSSKARIHRLIQYVNRTRLRNLMMEVDVLRRAMNFALEMDVQHVINVWECLSKYPDLVREFSTVPSDLCDVLVINGTCDTLLSFSEFALPVLKTHVGNHSPEVMKIEVHVAQCYMFLGKYAETEEFLKKFILKWRKTSLKNNEEYFLGKFLYGCVLEVLDRVDESLNVFKEIVSNEKTLLQVSTMCFSLSKMKITSLMLKKGVLDEEEWNNLERSSRESYEIIRNHVEKFGLVPGWDAAMSRQVNRYKISKEICGCLSGVSYEDIFKVFLCFQHLPLKTGKWEEAYKVSKWCIDILSRHDQPSSLLIRRGKAQLAIMLMKLDNRDLALKELRWLSSELNADDDEDTHSIINLMLGREYCSRGRFEEGIPKLLDLCFNKSQDVIHEGYIHNLLLTVKEMWDSGEFDAVSRIVGKLFSEMEKNIGKEGIPLFFLENSLELCYKLYKEGSRKVDAMNLLKQVYQSLKVKFGETHTLTLHAKLVFARFYCWFGKKSTFKKGVSYLLEVKETLSNMLYNGDTLLVMILMQVQRDITVCKHFCQVKPINYKNISGLHLGGCCAKCCYKQGCIPC